MFLLAFYLFLFSFVFSTNYTCGKETSNLYLYADEGQEDIRIICDGEISTEQGCCDACADAYTNGATWTPKCTACNPCVCFFPLSLTTSNFKVLKTKFSRRQNWNSRSFGDRPLSRIYCHLNFLSKLPILQFFVRGEAKFIVPSIICVLVKNSNFFFILSQVLRTSTQFYKSIIPLQ